MNDERTDEAHQVITFNAEHQFPLRVQSGESSRLIMEISMHREGRV